METVRVLHVVVSMDVGGIETMLMNYYRAMDKSKVQFDFLLHTNHKSHFEEEILSLGGRIYRVPSYHPKHQLSYRMALNRFFKEHTYYKVVHSHIGFYGMYALRAAKKHGVPLRIAHSHCANKFWRWDISLPFRIVTRHGLKKQYTNVYACSPQAAEYMAPKKEYTILNNAVTTEAFVYNADSRVKIRKEFNIPNNSLVIGHIGRFTDAKNHSYIIDIFAELTKINPDVLLVLVGSGSLLNDIKEKVTSLNISDKVIFTGLRQDIADIMSAVDVFVFPSKYEGFPVTLVEAQCSDLPCIVSDTITDTVIISDKVKTLSINSDPLIWAKEISNINISQKRRNNCNMMINAGFDIASNAERLQNVYLEAYSND